MSDDDVREIREAWARFGQYMQGWSDYGARMLERNQKLWAAVNEEIGSDLSPTDAAARSAARVWVAGMQNAEDLWTMAMRSPDTARYVKVLPTAFLFFDLRADETHTLIDPVEILVPADASRDAEYPPEARIALSGTSTTGNKDAQGVEALLGRLSARRVKGRLSYGLEAFEPDVSPGKLVPGVYDGLLYLIDPPMPLANLRVVVEAREPESPRV